MGRSDVVFIYFIRIKPDTVSESITQPESPQSQGEHTD